MRVVGYVRVSRVAGREGPSFISPGLQSERITAWAEAGSHELVEVLEDLDSPGSRVGPGLNRAMSMVADRECEGIVVAKLDRFGRSVVHLGQLVERLREAGGALFSVAEGVDTRTTTGKLVADILTAIAEWELDRIRGAWAAARHNAQSRGVYLAEAPVGYTKVEDGSLAVDEVAPFVTEAFTRRVSGDSWQRIATWLNESKVASRRGGQWTVASVRRMVGNRAYVDGPHERLTSPSTFEAANAVRGVAPSRSGRGSGLLSGLLRCSGCRYAMKLSQGRTRHDKSFTEYRCKASRGESAGGRCPSPASVKSGVIEPFVLDAFWRFVGDYDAAGLSPDTALEDAEREVREAEAELDAALDTRLVEALGAESPAYLSTVRTRKARVDEARAELANVRRAAEAARLPDVNLRELWPDLSLYEQRKLLASVFDCVFIRRTPGGGGPAPIEARAFVCWHGEAPELPVRGRRWTIVPFEFPASSKAG